MADGHKSLTWRIEKVRIKLGIAPWVLFILDNVKS